MMKRSTLLTLAYQAWQTGEKNPEVAEALAASGFFTSYEIYQITHVRKNVYVKVWRAGSLNPATLDMLRIIARCVENGEGYEEYDDIVRFALGNGTTRSVMERLTGCDTNNPRRQRSEPDGTSGRDTTDL